MAPLDFARLVAAIFRWDRWDWLLREVRFVVRVE
jgi:hypothetical protein